MAGSVETISQTKVHTSQANLSNGFGGPYELIQTRNGESCEIAQLTEQKCRKCHGSTEGSPDSSPWNGLCV